MMIANIKLLRLSNIRILKCFEQVLEKVGGKEDFLLFSDDQ